MKYTQQEYEGEKQRIRRMLADTIEDLHSDMGSGPWHIKKGNAYQCRKRVCRLKLYIQTLEMFEQMFERNERLREDAKKEEECKA